MLDRTDDREDGQDEQRSDTQLLEQQNDEHRLHDELTELAVRQAERLHEEVEALRTERATLATQVAQKDADLLGFREFVSGRSRVRSEKVTGWGGRPL